MFKRFVASFLILSVVTLSIIPPGYTQSITALNLPIPGTMVMPTEAFVPVLLKGMTVHPDDPFKFDFIVDSGNADFSVEEIEEESERLVKYFLASMTVPKNDFWVNLSPYEEDRIIPDELAKTALGRDMLAQDYLLKQLTASLIYPEDTLGKEFWERIESQNPEILASSSELQENFINLFNKVWIIPESASVYEYKNTVYVVDARLKVMLDSDYLAQMKEQGTGNREQNGFQVTSNQQQATRKILRSIIIPQIEKEVNEGKNFARLRQIYHSLILAKWYKQNIKNSILAQVYTDQNKTEGIEIDDAAVKDEIYAQYVAAYERGVFSFIKEDYDALSQKVIPKKYFSGGITDAAILLEPVDSRFRVERAKVGSEYRVRVNASPIETSGFQEQVETDASAISSLRVHDLKQKLFKSRDLNDRKRVIDQLRSIDDPEAKKIIGIANRIKGEIKVSTEYDVDDYVDEFLPVALEIIDQGYDFRIEYHAEKRSMYEKKAVEVKRWELYQNVNPQTKRYLDYKTGNIVRFTDAEPDLNEVVVVREAKTQTRKDAPAQYEIVRINPEDQYDNAEEDRRRAYETVEYIQNSLQTLRNQFASGDYETDSDALKRMKVQLVEALSKYKQLRKDYGYLFHLINLIIKKIVPKHQFMFSHDNDDPHISRATQVVVLDAQRKRVLLQKRGAYKRLFPGKWTVSANAKGLNASADDIKSAVSQETGLDINADQITVVDNPNGFATQLISYEFVALNQKEKKALKNYARKHAAKYNNPQDIRIEFDEVKNSLVLFSSGTAMKRESVLEVARAIAKETSVPFMNPVFNKGENSVAFVQLTQEQQALVEEKAEQKQGSKRQAVAALSKYGLVDDVEQWLKGLDQDDMRFVPWATVFNEANQRPGDFALDLTEPYFGNAQFWNELGVKKEFIITDEDAMAESVYAVGGKGRNLHILRRLQSLIANLRVPRSVTISTFAFEDYVLNNEEIRPLIDQLDTTIDENELKVLTEQIRERIKNLDLSEDFKRQVVEQWKSLGRDIAVRSSATIEDLNDYSAAGMADSHLHVIDEESLIQNIKDVWASLYNFGFVKDRLKNKGNVPQAEHKMAVVLQEYVNASSAGAAKTVGEFGRLLIRINAQPGVGEATVEGEGAVDRWDINIIGDTIIGKSISKKSKKKVSAADGGLEDIEISENTPTLNDQQVFQLAKIISDIKVFYNQNGLANFIDVEFAIDQDGLPHIVQVRAEDLSADDINDHKFSLKITSVDEDAVPEGTTSIHLNEIGLAASLGTVIGELIIVDNTYDVGRAKAGSIVVVEHTNNEWNDVFGKLGGVITSDGGDTSHAAKNSRRLGIPSFVGASGVLDVLREYEGQTVTFDSSNKTVYIGRMPTKEIKVPVDAWAENEAKYLSNLNARDHHELFKTWHQTAIDRPGVFLEFFDGNFRRRSATYPYFELDYYYKAWDELTAYLNQRFASRAPFVLEAQKRLIRDYGLFHKIDNTLEGSIFDFLSGLEDVSIDDFIALFDERFEAFRTFAGFMEGINEINADNVERVMDELVEVFTWMHFAFWLNSVINTNYLPEQLASINREFHEEFRRMSIVDWPREKKYDLSRNKDKEIYAVLERIRANDEAYKLFESASVEEIEDGLKRMPDTGLIDAIEQWSFKYKKYSENISILTDTPEYISDLKGRIKEAAHVHFENIVLMYEDFKEDHEGRDITADFVRENDPDLYSVLRGYARLFAAQSLDDDFGTRDVEEQSRILQRVSEEKISENVNTVINLVEEEIDGRQNVRSFIKKALDHYPELQQVLSLSMRETLLREDGHHLIVPQQRKIAHMLSASAEQYLDVLGDRGNVFQLGVDEIIALMRETPDNRGYLRKSFIRHQLEDVADKRLRIEWENNPQAAVEKFTQSMNTFIEILNDQMVASRNVRVKAYYQSEIQRARQRIETYESMLRAGVPKRSYSDGQDIMESLSEKVDADASRLEEVGGIDFNTIDLDRQGSGVSIEFDPVVLESIKNIRGLAPVIINITPINSVLPLLGLEPALREEEEYAISSLN